MNEKKNSKKQDEKDYYTSVIIGQLVICLVLSVILFLTFSYTGNFGRELRDKLNLFFSKDGTVMISDAASQVFSVLSKEKATPTDAERTASGGDDLEFFEATDKTDFAPFVTTDKLLFPVEGGEYTSYFGYRIHPITKKWSFHTGIDIAADEGTPIRAPLKGRITRIGEDSRSGKYLFMTHSDGFVTFYCHCSEILVSEGMNINKGEALARVGTTGMSTGPHLHFEIRRDGIRLNPLWALGDDC